jgi:2-dehydro-3-deoxygluconokinase
MGKVLCFGEMLLRFSPDTEGNWLKNNTVSVHVGGAELNVATALGKWQMPVAYCTLIPDNYIAAQLKNYLEERNIDSSRVIRCGNSWDRLGIYYLPQGLDVKNAGIVYDRANSSFARVMRYEVGWDEKFEGIDWFHFSAVAPALSEGAADVCKEAAEAAREKGITVSIDLNYRAQLWNYGKKPIDVIPGLASYCDLIMGNVWAAETMLGIPVDPDIKKKDQKETYLQQAVITSQEIMKQFPNCKAVANTFRFDHTGTIKYYTALYTGGKLYVSKEYNTESVIDKVGSGDCFMAGLIYGHKQKWDPQQIIEFATAAAFKKLFIKGDATTSTVEEIKSAYTQYA